MGETDKRSTTYLAGVYFDAIRDGLSLSRYNGIALKLHERGAGMLVQLALVAAKAEQEERAALFAHREAVERSEIARDALNDAIDHFEMRS